MIASCHFFHAGNYRNSTLKKFEQAYCASGSKRQNDTTKGGSRRLEKSHKVWMMMMIVASLMWAGAAEREHERECEREQPKLALKS